MSTRKWSSEEPVADRCISPLAQSGSIVYISFAAVCECYHGDCRAWRSLVRSLTSQCRRITQRLVLGCRAERPQSAEATVLRSQWRPTRRSSLRKTAMCRGCIGRHSPSFNPRCQASQSRVHGGF